MNRVSRIIIYPVKALDGLPVTEAEVLPSGALKHDREFALRDGHGNWINAKRNELIHRVRAKFDLGRMRIWLKSLESDFIEFDLLDPPAIESWFRGFLKTPVHLMRNTDTGFPDDLDSPGPTVTSTAAVRAVGTWFNLDGGAETIRRFRTNIEIDADEPFWDDRLFGREGTPVPFKIGDVLLHGINPCQRCAVPSRDPETGVVTENFQRIFSERRAAALPAWSEASRFNHYYRFSVNTRIPSSEAGKLVCVGDPVSVEAIPS